MGVEFIDYTLLKKRGLLKVEDQFKDKKYDFSKDGFVDLGKQQNESNTQAVQEQSATPVPEFLTELAQVNANVEPERVVRNERGSRFDEILQAIEINSFQIRDIIERMTRLEAKIDSSNTFK
jgi:hypothetical protein